MHETLDISEARKQFNSLDAALENEPVIVITRHNKRAFAIVNLEYLETITETLDILGDPESAKMLRDSLRAIEEERLIDQEDVEKELG